MPNEEITPVVEVKPSETTVKTEPAALTVSEQLGTKVEEKKQSDVVPIARLNKEIQRKKELEAKVADLEAKLADGSVTKTEVTSDLKALAEEHNVDVGFLDKLAKTLKAQAEADIDERFRPIAERDLSEKREKAFVEHFGKAMESMPEFKDVVNPEVIKQMAFNPANANKTFPQLIEEAYGNSLQGKRTIETATPRGGPKPTTVDIDRAKRDTEYFKEVMADPVLKKQYNDSLTTRVLL